MKKRYLMKKNVEEKQNEVNLLSSIINLGIALLPFIFSFFILLDINLLINTFNLSLGLIGIIFNNLNITNMNLLFIVIFIPFLLSSFVVLPIFIIPHIIKYIKKNTIFLNFCNKDKIIIFTIVSCFFIISIFLFEYFINVCVKNNDLFLAYILTITLCIIYTLVMKLFNFDKYYSTIIGYSILLIIAISTYFYNQLLFLISISCFLFILIFNSLDIYQFSKNKLLNNENSKFNVIVISFFIITFFYVYANSLNSKEWRDSISDEKIGVNYLTFNLIFNKGLLIKNKSNICVDIEEEYYKDELKLLSEQDNKGLNIDNSYWYLQITNNIKLFVKNLTNENKIALLLIEERIDSQAISKYSLIDMSLIDKLNK